MPSPSELHVGSVPLLVHVVAVSLVVALWVVGKDVAAICQAETPSQYLLSELRCKVNVVLFAFNPPPPVLSAALPLKAGGTVAARYELPFAGVVTEATVGSVASTIVMLDDVP